MRIQNIHSVDGDKRKVLIKLKMNKRETKLSSLLYQHWVSVQPLSPHFYFGTCSLVASTGAQNTQRGTVATSPTHSTVRGSRAAPRDNPGKWTPHCCNTYHHAQPDANPCSGINKRGAVGQRVSVQITARCISTTP